MAEPEEPAERKVGVYDRPASADRKWMRWLIIAILLLLGLFSLYWMMSN